MTFADVFRHDLGVVRRTVIGKFLISLSIGATLSGVLVGAALSSGPLTADFLVFSLWLVAGSVLSLGALLTAAVTIAADRETGRLRLLFGTPVTKSDVFVGTLLSRIVVTCVSVVAGFAFTGVILVFLSVDVTQRSLWQLAGFTILLCVVYASLGTVVSAISSTRLQAVAGSLVFYVWSAIWPQMVTVVNSSGGTRFGEPTAAETFAHFVGTLSPFGAYSQAVTPEQAIYAEKVTSSLLATSTMFLILLVWAFLPVPVGYWWFSRIDL